jgi:hypothetical protein
MSRLFKVFHMSAAAMSACVLLNGCGGGGAEPRGNVTVATAPPQAPAPPVAAAPSPTPAPAPTPAPVPAPTVPGKLLVSFDEAVPVFTGTGASGGAAFGGALALIESVPSGGAGNAFKITRGGGEKFAGAWLSIDSVPSNQGPQKVFARVYSPTAGIQVAVKLEFGEGQGSGDVVANEVVTVGWQTLSWTFRTFDPAKTYNRFVMLPNLGKLGAGETYYFDSVSIAAATQSDIAGFTSTPGGNPSAGMGSAGPQSMPIEVTNDLHDFISAGDAVFASDFIGTLDGNKRHAAWTNAATRGVASNGNIGFFQDPLLDVGGSQIVTSTGWVSGKIDGPASVANFFRVFVFRNPASFFSGSYIGLYVNARNNGTVDATNYKNIRFKLWGPAEMYQKSYVPALQIILSGPKVQGCATTQSGGTELVLDFSATQKLGAGSSYSLPLDAFRVNGLCGTDTNANASSRVLSQLARVSMKVPGSSFNFQEPLPNDATQFATGINLGSIAFSR